jgi:hypothetical protein
MLCAGQWLPRRSKLKVLISTPLHPLGNDWQAALQLHEAARRQILAELSEPDIITAAGPTSSSENFR